MKKIIVYDFDKTLTYKDTLFGFFVHSSRKNFFYPFKYFIYICTMVLSKLKFISNIHLKQVGIKLFLSNIDEKTFLDKSLTYKKKVRFNELFESLSYDDNYRYFVISASFEEYLKPIFPNVVTIIASQIKYKNGTPYEIGFNCYKEKKVEALKSLYIEKIDVLYTDSYNDYSMAKISKKIIIVDKDNLIECSDFNEFYRYYHE